MPKTTSLHDYHVKHGKMTEFAGYDMPIWYTTTTDEHMAVRTSSGIFDVSHMGRLEVKGKGATDFLERLVPTDVGRQQVGKAFYTLLLNDEAGIIDDMVIERTGDQEFTVVVNAANRVEDFRLMSEFAREDVKTADITDVSVMIAVQGPAAEKTLQPMAGGDLSQLKKFRCIRTRILGHDALVSRTGYTGEDGFEAIVYGPTVEAPEAGLEVWEALARVSQPCGLGARDSLRLEAGLPLHGSDIDKQTDPFQAGLSWVLSEGKEGYPGWEAVARLKNESPSATKRGISLDRGIPRHGFRVLDAGGSDVGVVTSGTYSPVIKKGIALGRVSTALGPGSPIKVVVRESPEPGVVTKTPFYDERLYGWKRATQY